VDIPTNQSNFSDEPLQIKGFTSFLLICTQLNFRTNPSTDQPPKNSNNILTNLLKLTSPKQSLINIVSPIKYAFST
jgi:hypothetical protein